MQRRGGAEIGNQNPHSAGSASLLEHRIVGSIGSVLRPMRLFAANPVLVWGKAGFGDPALQGCEWRGPRKLGGMNRISRAVAILLGLNIAVFAAGYLPNGFERIREAGAFWFPANPHFGPWQAVTYMFLHGNLTHLLFNMFALVSFGTILEREWGAGRFLVFYFLCGIGAGLIQMGINWHDYNSLQAQLVAAGLTPSAIGALLANGSGPMPSDPAVQAVLEELYYGVYHNRMVGASGAIYGLLVAFGCLHPNARLALIFLPVPIAAKFFIPILLALDLLSGVTGFTLFGVGIAHFAHLGGALIGFLLMLAWRRRSWPAGPVPLTAVNP
jgi:membrane associated rhomboid family serine protease